MTQQGVMDGLSPHLYRLAFRFGIPLPITPQAMFNELDGLLRARCFGQVAWTELRALLEKNGLDVSRYPHKYQHALKIAKGRFPRLQSRYSSLAQRTGDEPV